MAEIEEIMKQWDFWRLRISNGDTTSAPRDWFENLIAELISDRESVIAKMFISDGTVNWAHEALIMMDKANDLINFCSVHMPDKKRYDNGAQAFWVVCGMLSSESKRLKKRNAMTEFDQRSQFLHDEQMKLEKEMRDAAEQEIKKQFEYLWEKYGITGSVPPVLIESFKEIALTWYMRGRFIE